MWLAWATASRLQTLKRACVSGTSASSVLPSGILELTRSVDQTNYKIMIPLPPRIDPSVTMMQVEERPSITYADVGGCKEQIEKLREVVELPLLEVSITVMRASME